MKIRCRSRRTLSSWRRQLMASQSSDRRPPVRSLRAAIATANAVAVIVSNLSFGSGGFGLFVFKGSPAHVSLLSQPGTRPGIRPVIRDDRRRSRSHCSRFPVAFRPPAFASWASCSRQGVRPLLTVGLPQPPTAAPDPDGVSTFRTHETRLGWVPSIPRGRRCPRGRQRPRPPPAASQRPVPVTPALHIRPGKCE